ncbi:MAG: sigma 54-interacting transcriptional regulator [Terriglobia bacterium]
MAESDSAAGGVLLEPFASSAEALLEVWESIASHRDLPSLIRDLTERLPRLVNFTSLWLVLHEPARNKMRLHVIGTPEGMGVDVIEREVEDSPSGLAWQTQRPFIVIDTTREARFPEAVELLRREGVRSFCILPLTTAHRRLGGMGFGSPRVETYRETDMEFLRYVAGQVAVAVDNALSQQDAQALQRQLERERDRLRLLLELNNNIVSNLNLREMLRAVSTNVQRVMKCDFTSVAIRDTGDERTLRAYARYFSQPYAGQDEEIVIPMEETISGTVITTGEELLLDEKDFSRFPPRINPVVAAGLKSGCFLPLVSHQKVLGSLNVGKLQEGGFAEEEVEFLRQVASQVAIGVENALNYSRVNEVRERLAEERVYLNEEIRTDHNFEEIIGDSHALKEALGQVKTVALTDSTALILGETGTGKELIARAIHNISSRRERTFVKVNCAAIPLGLLESELFGHEKGAFTGAIARKIGRFELADQGTLFLDEVGDIPLELQPKLLRVLQEQEFERLGSSRTLRVNVRLVAATSRNLLEMVDKREFRGDLYYRLNVFPITIPPLRERAEDIPLLARYFAEKYARRMNKRIETIPADIMQPLIGYHWPGNIRELQNFIERAVILSQTTTLQAPHGELERLAEKSPARSVRSLAATDRDQIIEALAAANWALGGPGGAAERLGLKRTTLLYRMRRLGISRPADDNSASRQN